MKRKLLIAAAAACLAVAPSLAYSQATPAAKVAAVDKPTPAWAPTSVTITAGQTVAFESKGNTQPHYVEFTSAAKPACDSGVPMSYPQSATWSGTCTFSAPGDYTFRCPVHDTPPYATMRATVHVEAPTPTPTATPTPDQTVTPGATATPGPGGATPTPTPTAQTQTQPKTLAVKLAPAQKGARVRGSVGVQQANSRLVVTVTAKLGRQAARVGRWTKTSAKPGTHTFTVAIDKRARRTLKRQHSLKVTVAVTLTQPGGRKLARNLSVRLRG